MLSAIPRPRPDDPQTTGWVHSPFLAPLVPCGIGDTSSLLQWSEIPEFDHRQLDHTYVL